MPAPTNALADRAVTASNVSKISPPTLDEIRTWPATIDVALAGRAFGLSKSFSYECLARGDFPARALKVGGRWRVITASIIKALSEDA